ncbi:DUF397 domain-containing protein [Streptomyces sp. WM6386]|uniref:DUF397 domain-containing protein n=1 Tax=Streptomyces sp. WM6386 TaxID=1415558 RepID=UPI000AD11DDB|nr:DUF397 domain-containing protein [Streptomyces sp. WM6386]
MASRLRWRKSSYSGENGSCVEIAQPTPNHIKIRDSKQTHGPQLNIKASAWTNFLTTIRPDQPNT